LGLAAEAKEEYTRVAELLEESLALFQSIGAARGRHWVLLELGRVVLAQVDSERARVLMGESLRLCREAWTVREIARCLEGLASVAATTGRAARAASLFGAAVALRERIDLPPYHSDRTASAHGLAAARDQLDDEAFAQGWDEGRTMPLEQANVDAEELVGPVAPSATKGLPGAPESGPRSVPSEPMGAAGDSRQRTELSLKLRVAPPQAW
jgi:hypothetical protein